MGANRQVGIQGEGQGLKLVSGVNDAGPYGGVVGAGGDVAPLARDHVRAPAIPTSVRSGFSHEKEPPEAGSF